MPARHAAPKPAYRIRHWNDSTDALVRRGSLTLGVEQETLPAWRYRGPSQRGAPLPCSDLAFAGLLTLRAVYHLTWRATEGFAPSLFGLLGVDLPVPDSTTLCRRSATVRVTRPQRAEGPLHRVLDSTGLKGDGAGAWKVRQHGSSQRRTWLKLHRAVAPQTPAIPAARVTEAGVTDAETVPAWFEPVENPVARAAAAGASDRPGVSDALEGRSARVVVPPRRDAKVQRQGTSCGPRRARAENLRRLRKGGRAAGKEESGDHERSLVETALRRMQTLFGEGVASRSPAQQPTEAGVRGRALNIMTHQGMPRSERVAA